MPIPRTNERTYEPPREASVSSDVIPRRSIDKKGGHPGIGLPQQGRLRCTISSHPPMSAIHAVTHSLVVGTIGAGVWVATGLISSDSRPEGVYVYLNGALPVLLAVSAWAGWRDARRPWRWGVSVMCPIPFIHWIGSMGPIAPKIFTTGHGGYPGDLVSFTLFTIACVIASSAGAWLRTTSPTPEGVERCG